MTREEIIEYFKSEENRSKYADTFGEFPSIEGKRSVMNMLADPENIDRLISVGVRHYVLNEDEMAQLAEDNFHKRRVFFVTKDGVIQPLQGSDPQSIRDEVNRRMQAGDLCVQRDKDGQTRLYKNETYTFKMGLLRGEAFEIEEKGYHMVPGKNRIEYLQQYGFSEKDAHKLLNSSSVEWMDTTFVHKSNLEIPQESVTDLKNKMSALWDKVHGASLWWKNSGDYTDMHDKIREINEHLNKMSDTDKVADDAALQQMLEALKTSADQYLASKQDVKSFSENGQKRYDAAQEVLAALTGSGKQNSRSAETEEPKVEEPQKPEVKAKEPQVEEAKSSRVQELLDNLKEDGMVDQSLTVEQFALAVINSAPVYEFDKDRYTEEDFFRNLGQDKSWKSGAQLRREYGEFLRDLGNGDEISDEYKDILSSKIFKAAQNPTYDIGKLKDFNQSLMLSRGNTGWKFGEEILNVFGEDGLKKFTSENMKSQEQKKIYAQSQCLLEERYFNNYVNHIPLQQTPEGVKMIESDYVPEYLAGKMMEVCARKDLLNPDTLYYLKAQGIHKFSHDVCKAMKGLLTLPRIKPENCVKIEDIQNRVSEHSDDIVDRLNGYCNKKVKELVAKQHAKQKAAAKKEAPKKEAPKKVVTGRSL